MTSPRDRPAGSIGSYNDAILDNARGVVTRATASRRILAFGLSGLILALCALIAIVALALRTTDAEDWVAHSLAVRESTSDLLLLLESAESSARGFVLTNDEGQLGPYKMATSAIPQDEARLRAMIADNPAQQRQFDVLAPLIAARLAMFERVVEDHRRGEPPGRTTDFQIGEGRALMDRVRDAIARFDRKEADLLVDRRAAAVHARLLLVLVGVLSLVLALVFGVFAWLLTRNQERALRASVASLDQVVRSRTQALGDSEARFRQVFSDIPLGLAIVTEDGLRFVAANPGVCRMFDCPEADILGLSLSDFVHPEDRAITVPLGEPDGDLPPPVEKRYLTISGRVLFAKTRRAHLRTVGSNDRLLLAIIEDISRERQVEASLLRSQRLEAIGELTGGVAHDFNNLLGVIVGNAEALLDTLATPDEQQLAREILDTTERGSALTRRLLAFARRQTLQPSVIDLTAYLPSHVTLLQRTLGEAIVVRASLARGLWRVHADSAQIGDMLLNLAINARDAMPHGGQLMIETANVVLDAAYCASHPDAAPGEYVALSVADTGVGMRPEVLARAFEPFFTTKPVGQGSGLGLSMIYGFARQSGGHLSIYSEIGAGTTVRLYLPRITTDLDAAVPEPVREPPVGQDESILVVDDNNEMRMTQRAA